jgi:Ohr subfamily peroxiredoxin
MSPAPAFCIALYLARQPARGLAWAALYPNVSLERCYTFRCRSARSATHRGYAATVSWPHRLIDSHANHTEESPMSDRTVLYTGKTTTTGGRDGQSRSNDGQLDIKLSPPGSGKAGTNPEQLFGAGWSACFIGAMGLAARANKIVLPADTSVSAEVDLVQGSDGYALQARLNVSLPGIDRDVAQQLIDAAHQTCPYSKATRGNIDVVITLV